jgi:chorismate dehydratase
MERDLLFMFNFAADMPQPVRISIVNYTNTLPFKWAIKRDPIINKIDLQEDIPSICGQKLKFGQVDLALIPVALIAELDTYFIETDYCIGANGRVDSVKLYSDIPLSEVKTVTLDYQSKSSITLARVLFKNHWKLEPLFLEAKPGFENAIGGTNAAVVIGDRTFPLNGKFRYEFDLAEVWKQFTGLPFVFAAWVSTGKLDEKFIDEFNSVLKYGVEHIEQAIAEQPPTGISAGTAMEYLTERIDYNLDIGKLKALDLFIDFIRKL